jgi:hypothetical protein
MRDDHLTPHTWRGVDRRRIVAGMTSHVATVLAVLAGCQRVHREVEPPRIDTPAVTTETAAIRSTATARDPSPPPATAVAIPSDLGWLSPEQKSRFLALAPAQRRYVEQFCRWQQFDCTRFRLGASASAELALAYPLVLARHVGASVDSAESYCRTEPPGFREMRCRTPLVVAFDAQPVELLPATRPFAFTRASPQPARGPPPRRRGSRSIAMATVRSPAALSCSATVSRVRTTASPRSRSSTRTATR